MYSQYDFDRFHRFECRGTDCLEYMVDCLTFRGVTLQYIVRVIVITLKVEKTPV